jgi:aspartate racemase
MKKIGLLGGTSWPSTFIYYDYINKMVSEKLGGYHSARIILYSIDYHAIKSLYMVPKGWDQIPKLLQTELNCLSEMKPDCIMICNNTLHKVLPTLTCTVPIVSIMKSTGDYLVSHHMKKVLFVGTQFTMEDGFFSEYLKKKYNLNVDIPEPQDRSLIQKIQSVAAASQNAVEETSVFMEVLNRYQGYDAIVLACTELPLVAEQSLISTPLLNTIHIQCDAALKLMDL